MDFDVSLSSFFCFSILVAVKQQLIKPNVPRILLELAETVKKPTKLREEQKRAVQDLKKAHERVRAAKLELKEHLERPRPDNLGIAALKITLQDRLKWVQIKLESKEQEVKRLEKAQELAKQNLDRVLQIVEALAMKQIEQKPSAAWLPYASFVVSFMLALSTIILQRRQIKELKSVRKRD